MSSVNGTIEFCKASPKTSIVLLLAFLGALGIFVTHALHFDFVNDDAFISFRYAYNFAHHGQLVYNLNEPVEGYTNFLWTIIISFVIALDGDPVFWSKLLGILFSVCTLFTVFFFSLQLTLRKSEVNSNLATPYMILYCLIAPLLLSVTGAFACWSEGGLETALFTFLLTLTLVTYLKEELENKNKVPFSALFVSIAALTRPEGILIFGLLCIHMVVSDWVLRGKILPQRRRWVFLLIFIFVYGPYWYWRFSYYGYPFPNTYYLKGTEPLWDRGLNYLLHFAKEVPVFFLAIIGLIPVRMRKDRKLLGSLFVIICVPFIAYIVRVGGDFMSMHRFFVPLLPFAFLVLQESIISIVQFATTKIRFQTATKAVFAAILLVSLSWIGYQNYKQDKRHLERWHANGFDSIGWLNNFASQVSAIGRYVKSNFPEDTTLVIRPAGAIAYYSQLRSLDGLGLNDIYVSRHGKPLRKNPRPGHQRVAPKKYVFEWDPDLYINHPTISKHRAKHGRKDREMKKYGYVFCSVKVPDLTPPYWSFYIKEQLSNSLGICKQKNST